METAAHVQNSTCAVHSHIVQVHCRVNQAKTMARQSPLSPGVRVCEVVTTGFKLPGRGVEGVHCLLNHRIKTE